MFSSFTARVGIGAGGLAEDAPGKQHPEEAMMAIEATTQRYCPICGKPVAEGVFDRFGEWCCSEGHAQEYVAEVRAQKQRQHAAAQPQREPERPRRQFRGG